MKKVKKSSLLSLGKGMIKREPRKQLQIRQRNQNTIVSYSDLFFDVF